MWSHWNSRSLLVGVSTGITLENCLPVSSTATLRANVGTWAMKPTHENVNSSIFFFFATAKKMKQASTKGRMGKSTVVQVTREYRSNANEQTRATQHARSQQQDRR